MATREKKIVLLGKEGVGKSTMMHRIRFDKFEGSRDATIGAAFMTYNVIDESGKITRLHFWDTAGNDRFTHLLPMYIRGALVIVICFSDFQDIDSISKYVSEASKIAPTASFVLVATKIDLFSSGPWQDLLEVQEDSLPCNKIKEYCQNHSIPLFFTSSKTGQGVKDLVEHITSLIVDTVTTPEETITLQTSQTSQRCCF